MVNLQSVAAARAAVGVSTLVVTYIGSYYVMSVLLDPDWRSSRISGLPQVQAQANTKGIAHTNGIAHTPGIAPINASARLTAKLALDMLKNTHSGGLVTKARKLLTVKLALTAVFTDIPGDFVEMGVFNGGTAILMAKVLDVYDASSPPKVLWAADSFQGLPDESKFQTSNTSLAVGQLKSTLQGKKGQFSSSRNVFEDNIKRNGLQQSHRIRILEGWFSDTIPRAPIGAISFLRLDGDIYKSTRQSLDLLYDKVSIGGFIYVDDYGSFSGCKAAVDEYREKHAINEPMFPVYEGFGAKFEALWWQKKR